MSRAYYFMPFALAIILFGLVVCARPTAPANVKASVKVSAVGSPSIDKPSIDKIEPPNWWIGHSVNPVQLLLHGRGLMGSTVSTSTPGMSIVRSTVSPNGDYLIVYLSIDANQASAGNALLKIENQQGVSEINYPVQTLPDANGKYQGFGPDDVIYLIMVDRFADGDRANNDPARSAGFYDRNNPRGYHGGDLQGIIDHLQYLKDFGVTTLWLTPIYDNSDHASDYHGYGAVDMYGVEEHFGDLAKYQELVARAHALGLKIIQDQVLNHVGPTHPWVDSSPTRTFINGTRPQHLNNVFDIAALTTPSGDPTRVDATLHGWFADILPDLNQDDPEMAQYLIQNSLWWIQQSGIDGIRMDTFPYVPRSFWAQWTSAIKRQHPQFTVVGEVFDGRPFVVSFFQGGKARFDGIDSGLDMPFDFPSCFAIRDFFSRNFNSVSFILNSDVGYPRASVLVPFFGNHDMGRFASMPEANSAKEILAYTYLLTMRGTPQIYYGDEIGMKGGNDPDNRRDFPGGFPGDSRSAFTDAGRTADERTIFNAVHQLLTLRQEQAALRGGDQQSLYDQNGLLSYLRIHDSEKLVVAINNTDSSAKWSVRLPAGTFTQTKFIDLLGHGPNITVKKGKLVFKLPARTGAIYQPN